MATPRTFSLQKAGISAAILTLAQNAATATCDSADGAADGVIENPMQCHWNPYALVCAPGQNPSTCITPSQAAAIKGNVDTLTDPVTGEYVFSGMSRGSEFDQIRRAYQMNPAPFGVANYQLALNNPNWDGSQFDLHTQLPLLDQMLGRINATDPDLRSFQHRGGKLIEWQGWDDAAFTPGWTVKYYDQVVQKTGQLEDVQAFYRLFMLPGVGHCGTPTDVGPNNIGAENQVAVNHDPQHDVVSALEAWVEHGTSPEQLIATQFNNNDPNQGIRRQRPICSYPAQAVYTGVGDMNDASNFVCTSPDG